MVQEPNGALAAAIAEARMSNKGLARRVRDLAEQDGHPVATDHGAIGRYLDGMQPKLRTAHFIALSISERLGRRVTPTDLGFTEPAAPGAAPSVLPAVQYPANAVTATDNLRQLARADVEAGSLPELSRWDHQATPSVITGYLFDSPPANVPERDGEPLDATAIRLTTASLMDLDFQLGGGHTRGLLLFFFQNQVLPLLASAPARSSARRELFAATAELTQMLGWSAYDAGRHGAAQRYFVQGLRLAREADDALLGARLLSNLSHQANYLGRYSEAVHLARAAQTTTAQSPSATVSAMLLTMEARALASLGDTTSCASVLAKAEKTFECGNPDNDPTWISYFNRAELAGESAHCFRDLRRADETQRFAALALPPATPPRTVAFINMVSTMGALHGGQLDQALAIASSSLQLADALQSSRYCRYVTDFAAAVSVQHAREASVVQFSELVDRRFGLRRAS